jgi:hypothetical protein
MKKNVRCEHNTKWETHEYVGSGTHCLLNNMYIYINDTGTHIFEKNVKLPQIKYKNGGFYKWPGFHIGNGIWSKEDVDIIVNEKLPSNHHFAKEILEGALQKQGIFLFEDIQMISNITTQ